MAYGFVDKISKMIPFNPTNPPTLQEAINSEQALRELTETDPQVKHLMEIALKLEGLYRHPGVHAAGVVISDRNLPDMIPLYKDAKSDMPVTQFSMKYIEDAGLIKFDFLGLKTLTVIQKALDLMRNIGVDLAAHEIPLEDRKTFDLLRKVNCVGVFQIESAGMRDVLKRLQPDRVEDLIALVALYRPGPMDDIPKYIACKHGIEPITYLHEKLQPILEETYGVMVYQEQVMQIAQSIGGYTLGQADILRRAMGKKNKDEMRSQKKRFIDGATERGVLLEISERLFEQMNKFAGYGFNKSHATPYGLLT
jgi:DNA polymerase-3 subunit alpha